MSAKALPNDKARFDTRLSAEQKQFFERAASIGGYRSLTDFVILTVQEKATEIIKEKEKVLISQKDSELFFDALMNPPQPNAALKNAFDRYKKQVIV